MTSEDSKNLQDKSFLTVLPYEWVLKDEFADGDHVAIHAWCLDQNSTPHLLRIEDFPALCYLELPCSVRGRRHTWNDYNVKKVIDYLEFRLKDHAPIGHALRFLKKTYYYKGEVVYPMLMLKFKSHAALDHCKNLLNYPLKTRDLGTIRCHVWENEIPTIRKLLTNQNLSYSQWFTAYGTLVDEGDKISTIEHEYILDWLTMTEIPQEICDNFKFHPTILAFDIECYSDDRRIFPNEWCAKHKAYMISCIYQRYQHLDTRKRYAIILGECAEIPPSRLENTEIIHVKSEYELVQAFADLVLKTDPEIVTGYNIFSFDYKYLHVRLIQKLHEWPIMGRLLEEPATMASQEWSSGAYGHNIVYDLKMDGRINVDLLPIIKRDHKLLKYTLDFVAEHFLGAHKHNITAADMFWIYEQLEESTSQYENMCNPATINELSEISQSLEKLFEGCLWQDKVPVFELYEKRHEILAVEYRHYLHGSVSKATSEDFLSKYSFVDLLEVFKLLEAQEEFFQKHNIDKLVLLRYVFAKVLMTFVLLYCIQDSELVLDLIEELNVIVGLVEMSKVCGVTIVELFTRGQQIRCVSLLYDIAAKQGFVLDKAAKPGYRYTGGFVYPPTPGLHDNVMCWDFSSLYPTIIMAYNIDYTTLVDESIEHQIPDELCNVVVFEQEEEIEIEPSSPDEKPQKKMVTKQYRFKFLNAEKTGRKGLLPQLEHKMVTERRAVRDKGKEEKNPLMKVVYHQRQLALKVVCNSFYGFLGVREKGKMPLIEGAMSITGKARESILKVSSYIKEKHGGTVIYGDSVTGDTPVICRDKLCNISMIPIEELYNDVWSGKSGRLRLRKKADLFTRTLNGGKEYGVHGCADGIQVWSDKGFTSIKHVMRHKTRKRIFEVVTNVGTVKVTEDHSLLDEHGKVCRPYEVRVGDVLLSVSLPQLPDTGINIPNAKELGIHFAKGQLKKIPDVLWSASKRSRMEFTEGMKSKANNQMDSQIKRAGIFFLNHTVCDGGTKTLIGARNGTIIEIRDLGVIDDYVYDLETENHHFSAGVGELVVHNTDSVMASMGIEDPMEAIRVGKILEKELSDLFPDPMEMELEKVMRMLSLKKKRYVYAMLDWKTGKLMLDPKDLQVKGVEMARRDRPKWLTSLQEAVIMKIIHLCPFEEALDVVIGEIDRLLAGNVDYTELITVKGLGASYKSKSAEMAVFAEELKKFGKPAQSGSRLEFLVVESECKLKGKRMRLPETYLERLGTPEEEKIDYMFYIKKLQNPIGQLLTVVYKDTIDKLSDIYFRPTRRHNPTGFNDPIELFYRMIKYGHDYHVLREAAHHILHNKRFAKQTRFTGESPAGSETIEQRKRENSKPKLLLVDS